MNDADTDAPPRLEQLARAFLTPRVPRQRRALALDGGELLSVATPEGEVALQRAGRGPAVLLLHGWEGQASDLAAFTSPLLDNGLSVLAMDLPAHGSSSGVWTSIPQAARALLAVGEALGPLHAVIAHSIGSAVLAEALHAGLAAQRVVLVAAPAHYEQHARDFATAEGLDADDTEAMLGMLSATIGTEMREISLPRRASHLRQSALFIHSSDDRVVPIEESLESAAAWPGARHVRVAALGHRRILSDRAVIATAIEFVATTARSGCSKEKTVDAR
jgi:pimeloyl-ACP methyl ester carboxylesterase